MGNMTVSIHQPNYLPWVGYFNKIKKSDIFVFFDDVQFERGKTYTSRTKILNQGKEQWLTVPVIGKGELLDIKDIHCAIQEDWQNKHLRTLANAYQKSAHFEEVYALIKETLEVKHDSLAEYNMKLIMDVMRYLGVETRCVRSSELGVNPELRGLDKIIATIQATECNTYLSGGGAGSRRYIDPNILTENGIELMWQDFTPKEYKQIGGKAFSPNLSIVDLLFSEGRNALNYIV